MAGPGTKLRVDARENRDRILAIAREVLAADPQASLNVIAKTAGVGAGTLYRHFPNREAVLVGVYRKEIDMLVELAPALLAEQPPVRAFQSWCERFARFGEVKHGLADSLHAAISDRDLQDSAQPLADAVGRLMAACGGVAPIDPGVRPQDVLTLLSSLLRLPPTPEARALTRRALAIIYRGVGIDDGAEGATG